MLWIIQTDICRRCELLNKIEKEYENIRSAASLMVDAVQNDS